MKLKPLNISNKVRVLILGGGNAAGIKYRSFDKKDFHIDIYSEEVTDEYIRKSLVEKPREGQKNTRIKDFEDIDFTDYGIIVIATDNDEFNLSIRKRCIELNKLFVYCPDFRKGSMTVPIEIETDTITASIGTKAGSPETARYMSRKLKEFLRDYDDFIEYIIDIRYRIKEAMKRKEVMRFINSDDFYFFYTEGKADLILRMFYGDDIFEDNSWD